MFLVDGMFRLLLMLLILLNLIILVTYLQLELINSLIMLVLNPIVMHVLLIFAAYSFHSSSVVISSLNT